jgi:hypothetical protein
MTEMSTPPPTAARSDLQRLLLTIAAISAAADGLIHLNVIGDHLDSTLIAVGFAFMGVTQWLFALMILTRPSRIIFILGGILHSAMTTIWILSRTTGLWFVTGAENPAPVGVADLAANAFSIGVVGATIIGISLSLSRPIDPILLPATISRLVIAVLLASALFLIVPALLAPHDHGGHASNEPASETSHSHDHGLGPAVDIGEPDPGDSHPSTNSTDH